MIVIDNKILKFRGLLLLLFFVINTGKLAADVDSRFKAARELAFDGKRIESIDSCMSILNEYPDYHDVRVFMARVFAWEKKYEESRENLLKVLEVKNDHKGSINAMIDIDLWSNNPGSALDWANNGLKYFPNDEDFLIKKAKALEKLNKPKEAGISLNQLLNINPSHEEALKMQNLLALAGLVNKIGVHYDVDLFTNSFAPWHFVYLDFSRKFGFGSVILKLNHAKRFNRAAFQIEADLYLHIRSGTYSYLNLGYSGDKLFPAFRFGIEPYQKLPNAFEMSLGFRYLSFESSAVRIYTGQIGKYLGNYWLSFRLFISPKVDKTSPSGTLNIRRYLSDADNYFALLFGLGFLPFNKLTDENFGITDSRKIGLSYQTKILRFYILKTGLAYEYEEYYPGKWRNRYNIDFGIQRMF